MRNLIDSEVARLKDVLFKHLNNEDLQTWATAAMNLIKLGELSAQETQSEVLEYMKRVTQALEKEEKKGSAGGK